VDAKNKSNAEAVWIEINGSIEIGAIGKDAAKAIGLPPGPIRLAEGLPGPKGYGLAHIDEGRAQSLKKIGFDGVQAAFVDVAANWECAIQANEPNKVVLVKKHMGRYLRLVVQVFDGPNGHYWSSTTIIVGRMVRAEEIVFKK
jgi:hypothetical protein